MKRLKNRNNLLLAGLLFNFSIPMIGQKNELKSALIQEKYTYRTASFTEIDSFYFDLKPVKTSLYKTHIRVSFVGRIIDFYSTDNESFSGILTNYITQYSSIKNKKTSNEETKAFQYFFEKIPLYPEHVKQLVRQFYSDKLDVIPGDVLLKNWSHNFLDCNSIVMEFNKDGQFTQKNFDCPWEQDDTVPYSSMVLKNYNDLKHVFLLDSLYKIFESKLPKGKTYANDGYKFMYILTEEQLQSFKTQEAQLRYLKSMKDTIDDYLNTQLSKFNSTLEVMDNKTYHLTFNKYGHLKKITINDLPTLFEDGALKENFEERYTVFKEKQKLKRLFRKIHLRSLHLKYGFNRTLMVGGAFILEDNTLY